MVTVGAIIQVRLNSERLPNKAFLPLPFGGGPALIEHVIQRASAAPGLAKVIIATTEQPADNIIQLFCKNKGVEYYRGSTDNVLERFVCAAKANHFDVVVRLTGDNPFISPNTISSAIQKHLASGVDYTITEGLPLGANIEVVGIGALERAAKEAIVATDKEHVTPFIRREAGFSRQTIKVVSPLASLRLTVDYPSDYALASLLYERLYKKDGFFDFYEIELLYQENSWISAINNVNSQRKAFASEKEELEEAKKVLQSGGFTRVLQRLRKVTNG